MTELKVFTATVAYGDFPEGGTWMGVVMASDEDMAHRLFGRQILIDNRWRLTDTGAESFAGFFDSLNIINWWEGLPGTACPCCSSHDTVEANGGLGSWNKPTRVCNTCHYQWLPLGFEPTVQKSAAQAWQTIIDSLDEDEAASLLEEEDEHAPID